MELGEKTQGWLERLYCYPELVLQCGKPRLWWKAIDPFPTARGL